MDEAGSGDGNVYDEYDAGAGSGDSEESGEEEMVEVSDGNQTLYFQSKDGMAQCEFCGKFGVRDAFYSKTKQFCSVACSRNYTTALKDGTPIPKYTATTPIQIKTTTKSKLVLVKSRQTPQKSNAGDTFNWSDYLDKNASTAAPVSCFKHCPMSECWDKIAVGMKVEVINCEVKLTTTVFWIASVTKLSGYKAQLRFEGYGTDSSQDFWINLCSKHVHPVGWCALNSKPLVPPLSIQEKYNDWKDFLVKRLTGARTLPPNFYGHIQGQLRDCGIRKHQQVEVVDKMCVSSMRVATVEEVVGGRLKLRYYKSDMLRYAGGCGAAILQYNNDVFWCHTHSPLLHPVGWSSSVGHKITASQEYKSSALRKVSTNKYDHDDVSPDMLPAPPPRKMCGFQRGMKIEAIDPLNLSSISVATVAKVLRDDYVMVGIDGSSVRDGSDWFCYHASSPSIFPVGFCEVNNLTLTPPKNFKGTEFRWVDYLKQTKSAAAPVKLFNSEMPNHGFRVGMKLEAADLMDPRLICVGTVTRVIGRLLCVHFDGWESAYDQWVDCESPDIYPVGWCELVSYHLEGPRPKESSVQQPAPITKKRKSKSQIYRGPRKKRKARIQMKPRLTSQGSIELSELSQDSVGSDIAALGISSDKPTGATETVALATGNNTQTIVSAVNSPSEASPANQGGSVNAVSPQKEGAAAFSLVSPKKDGALRTRTMVTHNIPRVIPGEPDLECAGEMTVGQDQPVTPHLWSVFDVCQFLRINDCAAHCDSFKRKDIDGSAFLKLTKEQIVNLIGMKVGPSLKVYDLIQQLKERSAKNS